jgi:hypothetical protein
MFKKRLLQSIPYIAALITGGIFYFLAISIDQKFYDLLINISAAFFAVPLLYLFYETAKSFSHKRLNREIFDYAKMQVDKELLSIINQLQKIVYTLEEKDLSEKAVNKFLSIEKGELENILKANKYLGFQIFKHWEFSEKGLHDLLKNPFVLEKMEDEQIITVICILKSLRALESIQKLDQLYVDTNEVAKGFKVTSGLEMNPENKKFPDRHLLLKHLSGDRFVVHDFGDIPRYNLDKSLKYYKVNDEQVGHYSENILSLLKVISDWLNTTGSELIIDTKMFKLGKQIT